MNKEYISPELEIVKFSTEDIIVTSLIDSGEAGGENDDVTAWK